MENNDKKIIQFEGFMATLKTEQEVSDAMGFELLELKDFIQINFGKTFKKLQDHYKARAKSNINLQTLKSASKSSSMNEIANNSILMTEDKNKKPEQKQISLPHIQVVNYYIENSSTMEEAYLKVYGGQKQKKNKQVNVVFNRPEVIEYIAKKTREIESMAGTSKATVLKTLIEIMNSKIDVKASISAASQISKMMGWDAPIKNENKNYTIEDVIKELQSDNAD